ncbi:GGDEF domain-containing protein [Vreelandella aquamarina]|uniref:GGDEF domain-containing protein n=1 Tax=Vreelandella aquamarina TaxID=77097 RepID=UPI00384DE774
MKRRESKSLGWQLGLGFTLLAGTCAIAIAFYAFQARQFVGANYTALVADVVRPQLHTVLLRTALEDLREHPGDPDAASRLDNLLWRVPRHVDGVSFGLNASRLSESDYRDSLARLQDVKQRLPEMQQQLDEIASGGSPEILLHQGQMIENDLAMAYSDLSELLHSEAGEQRIIMERLGQTVAVLVFVILLLVAGLLVALLRLKREHQRVMHLSQVDELTGLGNRRYLLNFTDSLCQQSQRNERPLSLALLDIDHFKQVNDTFGHPAGDRVLQVFARTLQGEIRGADVLARMGGEEFCVLMPDTDADGARELAERVRAAVASLTHLELGSATSITVSLGVATGCQSGLDFTHLYARADQALYQAKSKGRNRVETG